jgi:hypothetical protein
MVPKRPSHLRCKKPFTGYFNTYNVVPTKPSPGLLCAVTITGVGGTKIFRDDLYGRLLSLSRPTTINTITR